LNQSETWHAVIGMSLTSSTSFCAVYLPFLLRYGNTLLGD